MLRTESPSQGYRLTAASLPAPLVIRSEGTYGRGDRRCSEGAAVVEGFPREYKSPHLYIPIGSTIPDCAGTLVRRRKSPARRRELFLYEKSILRESDCLRGRSKEVCTDSTPPLFRP